jgi:hypothetical protein
MSIITTQTRLADGRTALNAYADANERWLECFANGDREGTAYWRDQMNALLGIVKRKDTATLNGTV